MIVMENPMQFTIVSDVPLDSSGAFCATNVENNGESAITTNPQKIRNSINVMTEELNKNRGEIRQHEHDSNNESVAIFFTPNFCESNPLKTHASPPDAIIINENSGMLIPASG